MDSMDQDSFRPSDPPVVSHSHLTNRESASTDHSLGKSPRSASINSIQDADQTHFAPHLANDFHPMEMEPPADESEAQQIDRPTELKKVLSERHTNMIAFSSIVGIGFFLQSGRVIYLAGPGLAWIAYILMGTAVWSATASLGEMTALFPVKGAVFEFPSRFIDAGIGYACGFAWVVIIAAEVTAVAHLFRFSFDPKYLEEIDYPSGHSVNWASTAGISPAVFVVLWLIFILAVNLLRVRIYGEIEYAIGVLKMILFVGLIMFNIINNVRTKTYFRYYQKPYNFASRGFVSSHDQIHTGGTAQFAAMWTAMTVTIFSMIGFESVSITAPENKDLDSEESIKLATRKITLRIILLYTLGTFVVGLNVPDDDPQLHDANVNSLSAGAHSAFVIAAVRDGVLGFPGFLNGFFIFSATSAGLNALYLSSRLLHALANVEGVWPSWSAAQSIRCRLEQTSVSGVPRAAVFTSWLFGWLGLLAVEPQSAQVLGRMATNSTVSILIVYTVICAAYLRFFRSIKRAAQGLETGLNPGQDPAAYNRDDRRSYPYYTHWQYARAWYGMLACGLMAFFNGWRSIHPISGGDFVAAYISLFIFLLLVAAYHVKIGNTWNPLEWRLRASGDLSNPQKITPANRNRRRGKLHRYDHDRVFSRLNVKGFWEWIWTWLQ